MSKIPLFMLNFSLSLFLFLTVSLPLHVISQSTEQTILLRVKRQLGDPPSLKSWMPLPSSSPCNWTGIGCSGGAVTEVLLAGKNITVQKLPSTICDLKSLTKLNLSDNSIAGEFPKFLYNCSNLRELDLSQNYIAGAIPADIDRLKKITHLNLGGNSFSGEIPPAIGNMTKLKTLHIFLNNFNGTLPKEIGNLPMLEILGLAENYKLVPEEIPSEFGNLRNLKFLWIKQCNLIGEIPESFGNLLNLEHLDLSMNNLGGSIPASLFLLRKLKFLYLYRNMLSGVIPSSVQALNLVSIDLAVNNLTGSIPEQFGKLKNLSTLHLYYNQLSGEIPRSLSLIPSLVYFRVFNNKLNGTLPPELGLYSKLLVFEVSQNQFGGGLPQHLCAGGALLGVSAFSSNLSGELPEWLGNCSSLTTVFLSYNKFSGEVPSGLWNSKNLLTLMLSNNSFSGQLPGELSWSISRLEIANNYFSGHISVGISSSANLVVFDATNNMLSGEVPRELTALSRLTTLKLDGNQLSGALPNEVISWLSLTTLTLSRNKISGPIPVALASVPNLVYLDLSENDMSGEIPPNFNNLRFVFLNLSFNKLSGNIPDEFNNLAFESSFLNNPELCAYNPKLSLPNCLTGTPSHSRNLSSKSLVLILVITIIVLLGTASLVFYQLKKHRNKEQCRRKHPTWRLTSFQRLDFTEMNLFSSLIDNNLIGSGGFGKVYRIASNRPGEYVAVKKIWNSKDVDDKLEKEFMAEVRILGNIRHCNIIKLLCCYSSENSKLLVYEYMENESLDKWLYRKKKTSATGLSSPNKNHRLLSWPTRLNIAIGAAQGLCYMHHECSPPIIHRDVKSSNILLDSEFRAKIADFGLAKILTKPGEPQSMSILAGSFGYIPPEYAYSTKINEKVDLYSFGVVLLELVTGREPNKGGEHAESLVDWAWQYYNEGKSIAEVFDEDIKETCYAEQMTNVFKLGLVCTSSLPSSRPSMKEILQILRQCCHSGPALRPLATEFDISPLLGDTRYISSYKECNDTAENEEKCLYSE